MPGHNVFELVGFSWGYTDTCLYMPERQPTVRPVRGAGFINLMHLLIAGSPKSVTATLPGMPSSVPVARRLVREAVPGCPRADDLVVAVSELVTNAIVHSASGRGGSFTMQVRTEPRWARVEITDEGPAPAGTSKRSGWGLEIVSGVTDKSAAVIQPDGCRTAWCEVTWSA